MSKKPRKPAEVKPVLLEWRWLHRSAMPGDRLGVLEIGGTAYAVRLIPGGVELKKNDGTLYYLDIAGEWGWRCDCPDAEYRSRTCKHVLNVQAAFLAINLILHPTGPARAMGPEMGPEWAQDLGGPDEPVGELPGELPDWEGP